MIIQIRDSAFPIGCICSWSSLNNFPNFDVIWFEYDDSEYDTSKYSKLHNVLQSSKLPDYRSVF